MHTTPRKVRYTRLLSGVVLGPALAGCLEPAPPTEPAGPAQATSHLQAVTLYDDATPIQGTSLDPPLYGTPADTVREPAHVGTFTLAQEHEMATFDAKVLEATGRTWFDVRGPEGVVYESQAITGAYNVVNTVVDDHRHTGRLPAGDYEVRYFVTGTATWSVTIAAEPADPTA